MDERVGIRELKSGLSEYLRRVKAGETIVITERGRPIGRIVPEGLTLATFDRPLWEAAAGMGLAVLPEML
ncbi:type II toxin-antitoxin system Phd/YefM family antitoxin [Promineifilum sp.]|uniref:type II toxin-antitoxin system Phd/YefM family antitoxin n=1 Tax=Promineifilum sp. TaxID=2664178 RepID=UPI0035B05D60